MLSCVSEFALQAIATTSDQLVGVRKVNREIIFGRLRVFSTTTVGICNRVLQRFGKNRLVCHGEFQNSSVVGDGGVV
jgi:hypothetical protein